MVELVIFRSRSRAACEERAFMLLAIGIAARTAAVFLPPESAAAQIRPGLAPARGGADSFELAVDESDAPRALEQLARYELEQRRPVVHTEAPAVHAGAWIGCLGYALALLAVTALLSRGMTRLDAFDLGELDVARMQAGQWWRALTALTLHLDAAHLLGNLGAGIWFGHLAGSRLGPGHAWLLILLGAGGANALEGLFGPADHVSVGASTAVFTALGLLAAHSWRLHYRGTDRWAQRWAPLIGGAILLGLLGSGGGDGAPGPASAHGQDGATIDLVAHALGFGIGALIGAVCALPGPARLLRRVPQWSSGLGALLLIGSAWAIALTR